MTEKILWLLNQIKFISVPTHKEILRSSFNAQETTQAQIKQAHDAGLIKPFTVTRGEVKYEDWELTQEGEKEVEFLESAHAVMKIAEQCAVGIYVLYEGNRQDVFSSFYCAYNGHKGLITAEHVYRDHIENQSIVNCRLFQKDISYDHSLPFNLLDRSVVFSGSSKHDICFIPVGDLISSGLEKAGSPVELSLDESESEYDSYHMVGYPSYWTGKGQAKIAHVFLRANSKLHSDFYSNNKGGDIVIRCSNITGENLDGMSGGVVFGYSDNKSGVAGVQSCGTGLKKATFSPLKPLLEKLRPVSN